MVDMKKKATDILEDYSNSYSQVDLETLTKFLEQAKAETIKELAEEIKIKTLSMVRSPDLLSEEDYINCIDNVVKEKVGDNK